MPKLSEEKINSIYLHCNDPRVAMEQLLQLCLDLESGVTVSGLKAANYHKIEQLEREYNMRAEDLVWVKAQGDLDALTKYISDCERGTFSGAHLYEAKDKQRELAQALEETRWRETRVSGDLGKLMAFIKQCEEGTFSSAHLKEAKMVAEDLDWSMARDSGNPVVLNGYIDKCRAGFYPINHQKDAEALLEEWANATIIAEWEELNLLKNTDPEKLRRLNMFIQRYTGNPADVVQRYLDKAGDLMNVLADAPEARKDWIDLKERGASILDYVNFISKHPYCEYREEAEELIRKMKSDLLSEMKRYPFKFGREEMYQYITTKTLTMQELVDDSHILTDRSYNHIKMYPTKKSEQRELPLARLENPHSEDGNTDVYFFGVSGSGKTCVLAGLMSQTGKLGFSFDPKGPGGGGNYAMELRNYARTSMLPPGTVQEYIQVIDAKINDPEGHLHKISFIEMSGEKTAQFAGMGEATNLGDLGPGAEGLLNNNNNKLIFFVIDPVNEKNVQMGENSSLWVTQSDVLNCVSSLLAKNKNLMNKVVGIHIILTKSDTLGDYVDEQTVRNLLEKQGYQAVLESIKEICSDYKINSQTGCEVGLYPYCVGKFMPGEVYTFDETDALKILRVVQENTIPTKQKSKGRGPFDVIIDWFNC